MPFRAAAILYRERGHGLVSPPSSILHQRAADITLSKLPCSGEISHAITDVRLGLKKVCHSAGEAQHGCGLWTDLHQPDLAHPANRMWIERTLNADHCISYRGRQIRLLRVTGQGFEVGAAALAVGPRQPNQLANDGWKRDADIQFCGFGVGGIRDGQSPAKCEARARPLKH